MLLAVVILIDTGTIRRNPEIKLNFDITHYENIKVVQRDILNEARHYLKLNGLLYYMTCSILPQENFSQIQHFLKSAKGQYEFLESKSLQSKESGHDSFFYAILRRIK